MAGSALGHQSEKAGVLTAIMGYSNSPQVGGISGLEKMFQQEVSARYSARGSAPARTCPSQRTLLPHLVDKLTPNGKIPYTGALQSMLKGLTAGQLQ